MTAPSSPRKGPPPKPPPHPDELTLARALFTNDPGKMDELALTYDGIGLYQTAAALRAHAAELRANPPSMQPPAPPPPPPPAGAPQCAPPVQGSKLAMVPGCRYRARIDLGGIECLGDETAIAAELEKRGFQDVRVYLRPAVLPADWPSSERQTASGFAKCTRFAEGTWGGALTTMARPDFVTSMWVAA